jgi:hypothetical protein
LIFFSKGRKTVGLEEFFEPRGGRFLQSIVTQPGITLHGLNVLELYRKRRSDKHAATVIQAEKDADRDYGHTTGKRCGFWT